MGVNVVDYSTLTVAGSAVGLLSDASPVLPGGAQGAVITLEDAQIRYRDDGTNPTATEGHLMNVGDVLTYDSWTVPKENWKQSLKVVKFIRVGGTSGKLKITYYD